MGDKVIVTKDGRMIGHSSKVCLNPEIHDSETEDCTHGPLDYIFVEVADVMRWWDTIVEIEEGATLGSLMDALGCIGGIAVLSPLVRSDLAMALRQYKEPLPASHIEKEGEDSSKILRLELYWDPRIQKKYESEKHYIWDRPEFHGWGTYGADSYPDWVPNPPKEGGFAIEWSHMAYLAQFPLILREEYEILMDSHDFGLPTLETRYAFKTNRAFRLGDLLYGIFWEMELHNHED